MLSLFTDRLPLPAVFAITFLAILAAVELGFLLARRAVRKDEHAREAPVGSFVGALLGLVAFMLAFSFGMASSRFEQRKKLVLDEANAVGTAYLRSELISEPERGAVRELLAEYVSIRVEAAESGVYAPAIARSEEIHDELWQTAVSALERGPQAFSTGLFIQSVNEVIDLHTDRIAVGLRHRVPGTVWIVLYFMTLMAMAAAGYHAGLGGSRGTAAVLALVLAFSAVLVLIVDLDRSRQRLHGVSQQALVELRDRIAN